MCPEQSNPIQSSVRPNIRFKKNWTSYSTVSLLLFLKQTLDKYKAICHSLTTYSRMFVEILWIQGSPLETLWNQGTIQSSKYLISHLRYLELIIIIVIMSFKTLLRQYQDAETMLRQCCDSAETVLGCEIFGNCLLSFPQNERIQLCSV